MPDELHNPDVDDDPHQDSKAGTPDGVLGGVQPRTTNTRRPSEPSQTDRFVLQR